MDIAAIHATQHSLDRRERIPDMPADGTLPPVLLARAWDGEIECRDGHHRLCALWATGRRTLERHEYTLIEADDRKRRFGKIPDLAGRWLTNGAEP